MELLQSLLFSRVQGTFKKEFTPLRHFSRFINLVTVLIGAISLLVELEIIDIFGFTVVLMLMTALSGFFRLIEFIFFSRDGVFLFFHLIWWTQLYITIPEFVKVAGFGSVPQTTCFLLQVYIRTTLSIITRFGRSHTRSFFSVLLFLPTRLIAFLLCLQLSLERLLRFDALLVDLFAKIPLK